MRLCFAVRRSRLSLFTLALLTTVGLLPLAAAGEEAKDQPFAGLKLRSIGPAAGGRVARVTGVAGDPLTFYAATAQGGVWKSGDGGHSWSSIFDDQPVASIGSIAVAPSDPNVVYVGSGEANIRGNVVAGNGIYRSTDAGKTWKQVWKQGGQIGKMVVHPTNPEIAFAAVLGHAFGPNPERGVYRTVNGGRTWEQVLKKDEATGASDVSFDPSNPRILFAGLWQARRRPWEMTSGGPGSGLYRSTDGGDSWQQLTGSDLPEGLWGKVGVAVAPSDGSRVYALIEAEQGGLFRSDDGGDSWQRINGHHALRQRAWYYSCLTVDPFDADIVWFPQVAMLRTIDGGRSIQDVPGFHHGDHHDVWIDPVDGRRMIAANDGGVELSADGGGSWVAPPLPIAQFYNVDADGREPYHVGGTMQDQGTASGPSDSLLFGGIPLGEWRSAGGGEAGDFVYDLRESGVAYAGEYGGIITVADERTGQARNISIYPTNPSGHGGEDLRVRFQWTAPIAINPLEPSELYHGANVLFRSTDRGQTWQAVSPDLTRNDKSKQRWSGGPITGDNTGVEIYDTIFSLALSSVEKGLIWVGTDDGLVQLSRDAGASWKNVTPPGVPEWATVEAVEASRFAAGTAYVAVDNHRQDDQKPYLFKTTDYGRSWQKIVSGLPADEPVLVVREDVKRSALLFAGTEKGLYVSRDAGKSWSSLRLNLPTVSVTDLVVKGKDLVVGTRGRSLWILDDITPLRETSDEIAKKPLHLFTPQPARTWHLTYFWSEEATGANPPRGAILYYQLKDKVEGEVTLEVLDSQGRAVRKLSSTVEKPEFGPDDPDEPTHAPEPELATEAGLHRAVWDLRYGGAQRLDRAKVDLGSPRQGPLAAPGNYTLRLTAGDQVAEAKLEVQADPRSAVSAADLAAQLDFALDVRAAIDRTIGHIVEVRSIRQQAKALVESLAGRAEAARLVEASQKLIAGCDALEAKLHNPKAEIVYDILAQKGGTRLYSNLAFVFETIKDGDGPPTQGVREVFAEQQAELGRYEEELASLKAKELAAVEALSQELSLPRIITGGL